MKFTSGVRSDWQALARELCELSREMCHLAEQEAWEAVTEREQRRRELITRIFARPVSTDAAPSIERCIREVLACDAKILVLGKAQKRQLAKQLEILRQGRKASRLYDMVKG